MPDDEKIERKPRRHVLRNTVFTLLSRAQGAVFTYLIIRLLLSVLSVEQYGLHALLFIGIMMNVSPLFQFGIPNIMSRFIPEFYRGSRFGLINIIFRTFVRAQSIVAIATALMAIIFADQIAIWTNYPDYGTVIRIFAFSAITFTVSQLYQDLLEGVFQLRLSFWINLANNVIRLSSLYVVTRFYPTLTAVVLTEIGVKIVRLGVYAVIYYRMFPEVSHAKSHTVDKPPWKAMRRYGVLSYLNEVGVALLSVATDMLLVTGISGALATGYFALANRITSVIGQILPEQSLAPVTRPLFFSEYGSSSSRQAAGFGFAMMMKASLFTSLLVGIWLVFMAEPVIVYWFDARFSEAGALLAVMAVFLAVNSVRFPLGLMLQNAHRVDLTIYAKATVFIKIGLGLWLVPQFGAIAMVWIAGSTIFLQNVVLYYFIVSRLGHRGDPVGMAKIVLNGLISAGIFYLIRPYFNSLIGVLMSPFVFFVIYVGINILHKSFKPEEREFINNHLPRRLWLF
ncbi:oligosaccharide flippase family protein [bacterium]|nr:oligosaccharide flippase family protein [bacterium]MBU1636166.1 oligosaccharide flippase family protein [bacterium]MBU1920813.1 oligosaccharide flippase family protein [bacterium]